MQTTLIVFLAMALAWFESNGHISLANVTFLMILALWVWDLKERLDEIEGKEAKANEQRNH